MERYCIAFYADAFFEIEDGGDKHELAQKYVEEHWAELVDQARSRLPEADYELYEL